MSKQTLITSSIIAVIVIILAVSVFVMLRNDDQNTELQSDRQVRDLENATELLEKSKPEEALEIIHNYKGEIEILSENGTKWLGLFITASEQTKDLSQLTILFEFYPEAFKKHEDAALLVADSYIFSNKLPNYNKVRSLWTDRETKIASWFVLDADKLLLEGLRRQAIDLLESRTFKDKEDIGRLVRLALLYSDEEPKTAWKYLVEAYSIEPHNPDIRYYRAKLLESVRKNKLAHIEYQAAANLHPNNLFLQDELANFYLRQKQYPKALETWEEHLPPPSLDKLWVKTLFWEKVTTPINFDWANTPIPKGRLDPLIQYLVNLEPGVFWNQEQFNQIANNKFFLQTQQTTFWLRLLNALKSNKENEALKLLQYNPFATISWCPELEIALKRVLTYRASRTFKPVDTLSSLYSISTDPSHQAELPLLFQQLEALTSTSEDNKFPEELKTLLLSKEIFSAVFVAAEWYEAGLQLHAAQVFPDDFPGWTAYNFTQALRHNRSDLEALEFAILQKPTQELILVTAELMIAEGDSDAALEKLIPLAKSDSDIGFRSAWLASLLYIEKQNYEDARNTIYSQSRLVNDILGQEAMARIAHLEGDKPLADKLYLTIESKSVEARSYLARKAFEEKDWKRARELTEQLVQDHPGNAMLKKNLIKILEEERKEEADAS